MTYTVFGATGKTGRIVAEALLDAGRHVRAVVRDADKAACLRGRAEIVTGDLEDEATLTQALQGVEGAYLLSPPNFAAVDFLAERRSLVARWGRAIAASRVPHVVLLSSIGAQHANGTGIIRSVTDAERALAGKGAALSVVRAAYFQENWGMSLAPVKQDGVLPSMFGPADFAIPMVASDDIGRAAANLLLDGPSERTRIVQLAGPSDYSPRDIAGELGAALGRTIQVVVVPPEQRAPTLLGLGLNHDHATLYAEMYEGIERGTVSWDAQTEIRRGLTPLATTVRRLLTPA